jgi:hypothetical protein
MNGDYAADTAICFVAIDRDLIGCTLAARSIVTEEHRSPGTRPYLTLTPRQEIRLSMGKRLVRILRVTLSGYNADGSHHADAAVISKTLLRLRM